MLLVAAFWKSDSVGNSTLLLQHLRPLRHLEHLAQAASAFVCQLIAEACSHGKQPAVSLHSLLVEVRSVLIENAGLLCRHVLHPVILSVQYCTLYCISLDFTALYCTALFCSTALQHTHTKDLHLLLCQTSCCPITFSRLSQRAVCPAATHQHSHSRYLLHLSCLHTHITQLKSGWSQHVKVHCLS